MDLDVELTPADVAERMILLPRLGILMERKGGTPYACHVDGQTWIFVDDPDAAYAHPDEGHPRLTVPYRYHRVDRPVPDPLPPLRNTGAT